MSEFRFACPHCRQRITGDAGYRGKELVCPACQKTLVVPDPVVRAPRILATASGETVPGKISTLALLSLVCALGLGLGSIPGIVLGHLARAKIRRDASLRGQRLATVGLCLGYFFLLATLLFFTAGFVVLKPKLGRQLTAAQSAPIPASRLVDEVMIDDAPSESAHNLQTRYSTNGKYMERGVRDARLGGCVSYRLKVDATQPMILRCTYWGNDNDGRRFDVLVDDVVVATQQLEFNDPGRFFDVEYDLPQKLTAGKTNVTVWFQAYPQKTAGGFYGCKMLRR